MKNIKQKQKTKVLNLFAGLGGNRLKWKNVEVTAVESDSKIAKIYQDNNPNDTVIVGDAMEYLKNHRKEFGFIWASPPCQKHSKMMKATRHDVADFFDLQLWQVIIFLSHFYSGGWVVENVKPYYKPLINPRKELGRHLIWSNFDIEDFEMPNIKNFITQGTTKEAERFKEWLGIKYEGNIYYKGNHCPGQVLRNCVHPDFGLHIFNCFEKAKENNQINYNQKAIIKLTSEDVLSPNIKKHFSANDVDFAYLLGVFNTSGIDGLQGEIKRLKKLKTNPSQIIDNIR